MIPNEVYTFAWDNDLELTREQGIALGLVILETRKDEIGRAPSSEWGQSRLNELDEEVTQLMNQSISKEGEENANR